MTTARETDAVFLMADLSGFSALTEAHGSLRDVVDMRFWLDQAEAEVELAQAG